MKYQLYKDADFSTGRWMGGTTTEMAIWPNDAKYVERDFIWRISSAKIEQDESAFSSLPDYDRVLMVLDGEVVLSHEGQRVARLKTLEQDRFDGAYKTRSFGQITDFNLMVRKGNEGYVDLLYPVETSTICGPTQETSKPESCHVLYCKDGYLVVNCQGESMMVAPGQLLVMHFGEDEPISYEIMGEGTVIRSQIYFDKMEGQLTAEVIPSEKPSFDDFLMCIYLANVQFHGAQYIFTKLKTQWFDQQLSAAIRKVEKCYLTIIAFLVGFFGLVMLTMGNLTDMGVILLFLGWFVVDVLLVSPTIYMFFMPKPVRKHIKDINNLTPFEQRVREEELSSNERVDKLLKKYKNSGKNMPEE